MSSLDKGEKLLHGVLRKDSESGQDRDQTPLEDQAAGMGLDEGPPQPTLVLSGIIGGLDVAGAVPVAQTGKVANLERAGARDGKQVAGPAEAQHAIETDAFLTIDDEVVVIDIGRFGEAQVRDEADQGRRELAGEQAEYQPMVVAVTVIQAVASRSMNGPYSNGDRETKHSQGTGDEIQ